MSNNITNEPVKIINPGKMQLADEALLQNPSDADWLTPPCPNRIFDATGKRGVRACCARCSCVLRQSNITGAAELRCPDCHSRQFYVWQMLPKKNEPTPPLPAPVPVNAENSPSDTPSSYQARDSVRLLVSLFVFSLLFEVMVLNWCKEVTWCNDIEHIAIKLKGFIDKGFIFFGFSIMQLLLFFASGFLKDEARSRIGWRVLLHIPGVFIMTFAGFFVMVGCVPHGRDGSAPLVAALVFKAIGWCMVYFSLRRGKRNENT